MLMRKGDPSFSAGGNVNYSMEIRMDIPHNMENRTTIQPGYITVR